MSHRITIDMFKSEYDEIKSVLAKNGRADLINVLQKRRDDDYKPPKKKTKEYHDCYADSDYSTDEEVVEESYTSEDVVIDSDGNWSLKEI